MRRPEAVPGWARTPSSCSESARSTSFHAVARGTAGALRNAGKTGTSTGTAGTPKPAAGGQRGSGGTPEVLVDFPFRLGLIDSSLELNALKGGRMQIKKGSKLSLRFACSLETKRKMLALSIFLLKY